MKEEGEREHRSLCDADSLNNASRSRVARKQRRRCSDERLLKDSVRGGRTRWSEFLRK